MLLTSFTTCSFHFPVRFQLFSTAFKWNSLLVFGNLGNLRPSQPCLVALSPAPALSQGSLIRLALRLFTFRYTSVPSKILWKSCFRNSFFFPLIAESQLRKVRESKQPAYKIFGKQTFAQFFFLHKILVMRHQLLSGYFGLYPPSLSDKSGGERSLFLLKMATLVTSVN